MSNNPSPSGANAIDFAERYKERKKIRDDDLGELYRVELYRARDAKPNTVWALDLYEWIGDLPEPLQQRLREALGNLRKLAPPALLPVNSYYVQPTQRQNKEASHFNYIEYALPESTTLDRWPQWSLQNSLSEAIAIVLKLANALVALQQAALNQQIRWIRPVLKPEKILIVGPEVAWNTKITQLPSSFNIVLADPGLATLLTDPAPIPQRSQRDDEEEVKILGRLFLQLLSTDHFQTSLNNQQEIDRARNAVLARYSDDKQLLKDFFDRMFGVTAQGKYRNAGEVADALKALAVSLPPNTKAETQKLSTSQVSSLQQQTSVAVSQREAGQPPEPPDELLIEYINPKPQERAFPVNLRRDRIFTLGNSSDDDVPLPKLSTARRLLILYQNGQHTERYVVTDAGNGSNDLAHAAQLDGIPLSPYFAALFYDNAPLEVADYRISLRRKRLNNNQIISRQRPPFQISQTRYVGNPGDLLQIQATIQNTTNEVDSFWIAVDGAPDAIQFDLPEPKELYEQETANVALTVHLPVLTLSLAGDYRLILRLISENYRVQIAALQVTITVLPQYDFAGALTPETLRVGDDGELTIENHGNLARVFVVQWRDRGQELDFVPPDATINVPARASVSTNYRTYIRGGKWRWLGGKQFHTMNVLIRPQRGGVPQTLTGQVISRALIPTWAPTVALLVLLLFLLAATFLFQPEFAHPTTVRAASTRLETPANWIVVPTPIAGTPFALRWNPLGSCFYSVYENGAITRGPNMHWGTDEVAYDVKNLNQGTVVEVRLRSCLLIRERTWQIAIAPPPLVTPTPTPVVLPAITVKPATVKYSEQQAFSTPTPVPGDGVMRLLVGQTGNFCLTWQVTGVYDRLSITPTLNLELANPAGEQCQPITLLFKDKKVVTDYRVMAARADAQVTSEPFARIQVDYPLCRVNIDASAGGYLAIREGPGRNFPERGNLRFGQQVIALSKPFKPIEQNDSIEWVLIAVENDPRPGWVAYREQLSPPGATPVFNEYLACPDISVMPEATTIPPTPTLTPTTTPEPSATPTATPASDISLDPPIVNPGGCATLKWKIEHVKEVYINEVGVIGEGERTECPTAPGQYTYEWRIVKTDGSLMKVIKTLTVNPGPPGTPAPPTPPK